MTRCVHSRLGGRGRRRLRCGKSLLVISTTTTPAHPRWLSLPAPPTSPAAPNAPLPPPAARCIGVFCVATYCGELARHLDNPLCVRAPTRALPARAADKPRCVLNDRLGAPSATRGACVGFVCVATHMAEDLYGAGVVWRGRWGRRVCHGGNSCIVRRWWRG
ncbi:hypothetical protein C8R44DRAFT_893327 [Mycena epipterygia]|nr:hypothetical protein C8R44DRAFT_893327 [Mycena epipterygia]